MAIDLLGRGVSECRRVFVVARVVTVNVGDKVRCICPVGKSDPCANHGRIARIVGALESRRVGIVWRACYEVEIEGVKYNALPEWLHPLSARARAQARSGFDYFLGVTGKL